MPSNASRIFFPYDSVRDQQSDLMRAALEAIHKKRHLIAHAPTGLGKTAAVLCPAISYALKEKKTVFFLTSKISQHEIAVELIKLMNKKFDLGIRGVDLVGRKYLCSSSKLIDCDSSSFYELCRKRRKYGECAPYSNIVGFSPGEKHKAKENQKKILRGVNGILSHLELREFAESFLEKPCCGYETSMLLAKEADVVIADYFHIFDSGIRRIVLQRMKRKLEDCIIIVDEAHNLPDRIRSLLSSGLSVYALDSAIGELEKLDQPGFKKPLEEIRTAVNSLAKEKLSGKTKEALVKKADFSKTLELIDAEETLVSELKEFGAEYLEKFPHNRVFLGSVANFIERWPEQNEAVIRLVAHKKRHPVLQVKALDASIVTTEIFRDCHSAILMSGTLLPTKMYADLLGIDKENAEFREFLSPFPRENKLSLAVKDVTTKYTERCAEEFEKIGKIASGIVNRVPGNSAVFFPSFALLESIAPYLEENSSRKLIKQKSGMNSKERSKLLSEFRARGTGFGAVLLAVSAGSFAEGIDFLGDQLLCAVIVGVPLGEMDLKTQCLVSYYQKKFGEGWHYAYIYPAMTRAIQASGRVIRDEKDRGVVVFLDKRYLWPTYRNCFPKDFKLINSSEPEKLVEKFWASKEHSIESNLVNKKLDVIDKKIKDGKRKLLNADRALGSHSKLFD